ncbi:type 1 glutamine amidotransferase [Mesorhizobium sp. LHD-90]|uniref:type 1 glutamine amidotransferase n=1 Tax=Mesorhizobium sp. LHD-90 TaxID=3071414 RepID=UPI0027E04FEF|nr:type 1 glutamine amidotransferase [Mesorhizobium sp. LHD-90]MDQ6435194.1 type 1 glutamine amidotransferase [Mesorhizobium sp. LHD-90]
MKVLVVQNFEGTGLGQVAKALEEAGAEIDLRRAHHGEALPDSSDGYDAAVLLGGGQNALADDDFPYIPALLDLSRDFSKKDKAVLGICLGSQLLARAFGGTNQIGGAREFGWCPVSLTDEGAADPVLSHAPRNFSIFQWHDDTFSLPDGALHLATSGVAQNQAFRIGRATYGIQFHFEADTTLVREWKQAFAGTIAEREPDWPGRFETEAARHGPGADAAGLALARAWVATI